MTVDRNALAALIEAVEAGEFHRLHPEPAKYEAFANALVALGIQVTAELQTALMYGPGHAAAALRAAEGGE